MQMPRRYDEDILDKIIDELKEKGIEASYAADFDPS